MSSSCPRCGLSNQQDALRVCPRCFLLGTDELEPFPESPPGLLLLEEIGRGGMGRVFRARHQKLQRDVAVKFLSLGVARDPAFEARFLREAQLLARLSHPNLVTVHDFGSGQEDTSYIVMELVAGGTLRDKLPLTSGVALRVARELCAALEYAHARGIVHRDIKPENVLFDQDGRARLADFGIARFLSAAEHTALTSPHVVLGTPAYMAPELYSGAAADARSDIFALGVLVQEMLGSGSRDEPLSPGPAALRTSLNEAMADVARRARALEPSDRFASVAELATALSNIEAPLARAAPDARTANELNPEERSWLRAVALTLAGATAVSLYALLVSATPRVLEANDNLPFAVFDARALPDGRVFTRARFETWPTLSAAAAWAVALLAYGLIRRHWRHSGLELHMPEAPLSAVRPVLRLAFVLNALFVSRLLLEQTALRGVAAYVPILGGILELGMVYLVWVAVLEAWRSSRPLNREPLLWLGAAMSLIPPVFAAFRLLCGLAP